MARSSSIAAVSCGTDAEMFGSLMTLASGRVTSSPSSARSSLTRWSVGEELRERGQHPGGERDVAQLDGDAGRRAERLDDRQQRRGGQRRGLVGVRVDDRAGRLGHGVAFRLLPVLNLYPTVAHVGRVKRARVSRSR